MRFSRGPGRDVASLGGSNEWPHHLGWRQGWDAASRDGTIQSGRKAIHDSKKKKGVFSIASCIHLAARGNPQAHPEPAQPSAAQALVLCRAARPGTAERKKRGERVAQLAQIGIHCLQPREPLLYGKRRRPLIGTAAASGTRCEVAWLLGLWAACGVLGMMPPMPPCKAPKGTSLPGTAPDGHGSLPAAIKPDF